MVREVFKSELSDPQALVAEFLERIPQSISQALFAKIPPEKRLGTIGEGRLSPPSNDDYHLHRTALARASFRKTLSALVWPRSLKLKFCMRFRRLFLRPVSHHPLWRGQCRRTGGLSFPQICAMPPSTKSSMPLTKLLSSDARNTTALAISSGMPTRPSGMVVTWKSTNSCTCSFLSPTRS